MVCYYFSDLSSISCKICCEILKARYSFSPTCHPPSGSIFLGTLGAHRYLMTGFLEPQHNSARKMQLGGYSHFINEDAEA